MGTRPRRYRVCGASPHTSNPPLRYTTGWRRSTAPVLRCADGALADSTDILAWADAQCTPLRAIYPRSPDRAAVVRGLEDYFNTRLGPQSRCWLYQQLRERRDLALDYGCAGVPAWERMTLRLGYPALIAIVAHVLDVTPTTGLRSEHEVRAVFDSVGEYLSDGRRYICGEEFTAADLTFSALAAPMLMPVGYGVQLPQPDELPPYTAEVVHELRAHPAGLTCPGDVRHRAALSDAVLAVFANDTA